MFQNSSELGSRTVGAFDGGFKLTEDFRSGYDRGHMVPAADAKISQGAMDETFFLSNVAPQVGDGFNRHCTSLFARERFCMC